ncbi:MAG: tetratricopeptide repeat protein [Bacillota bacterium]|nr:tetratricopeptide repeat protein [Bacillota bacterium]
MIDLKQELKNFPRIDIEKISESEQVVTENAKSAIVLYNKAIDSINAKSEDMAIIELKKAISLNPEFYEGMILLGLCYYYIKDFGKAKAILEKAMVNEKNGSVASRFYDMVIEKEPLASRRELNKPASKEVKTSKPVENKKTKDKINLDFLKSNIIKYTACFLLGAVIVSLCNIPIYLSKKEPNPVSKPVAVNPNDSISNQKFLELQGKYQKLKVDYDALKNAKASLDDEVDYNNSLNKLNEIEELEKSRNYEAAADKLALLRDFKFKENDKKRYDNLYNTIMPIAASNAYNQGLSLCNSRKYKEAIEKLNKVRIYGTNWSYMDCALYKLGVSYENINNSKEAMDIFQTVIKSYPASPFAGYSQSRIKEITNLQK